MPNKNENANVAGEKRDGHPGVALVYGCGVVTPWAYIPGTGLKSPVESVQEGPKKHKKSTKKIRWHLAPHKPCIATIRTPSASSQCRPVYGRVPNTAARQQYSWAHGGPMRKRRLVHR